MKFEDKVTNELGISGNFIDSCRLAVNRTVLVDGLDETDLEEQCLKNMEVHTDWMDAEFGEVVIPRDNGVRMKVARCFRSCYVSPRIMLELRNRSMTLMRVAEFIGDKRCCDLVWKVARYFVQFIVKKVDGDLVVVVSRYVHEKEVDYDIHANLFWWMVQYQSGTATEIYNHYLVSMFKICAPSPETIRFCLDHGLSPFGCLYGDTYISPDYDSVSRKLLSLTYVAGIIARLANAYVFGVDFGFFRDYFVWMPGGSLVASNEGTVCVINPYSVENFNMRMRQFLCVAEKEGYDDADYCRFYNDLCMDLNGHYAAQMKTDDTVESRVERLREKPVS